MSGGKFMKLLEATKRRDAEYSKILELESADDAKDMCEENDNCYACKLREELSKWK